MFSVAVINHLRLCFKKKKSLFSSLESCRISQPSPIISASSSSTRGYVTTHQSNGEGYGCAPQGILIKGGITLEHSPENSPRSFKNYISLIQAQCPTRLNYTPPDPTKGSSSSQYCHTGDQASSLNLWGKHSNYTLTMQNYPREAKETKNQMKCMIIGSGQEIKSIWEN